MSEEASSGTEGAPRRWKRRLAIVLVAVLAVGALGTGIAVAMHQHDEQVKKDKVAAEAKAAAAYVQAIRPLSDRVFDAVQPIQDSFDAFQHLRPGLADAARDVILSSGALQELKSVRATLGGLKAPATYQRAAPALTASLDDLALAVEELQKAVHSTRSGCVECFGIDHLAVAEIAWTGALVKLTPRPPMGTPSENGGVSYQPRRPTRGGFIAGSDLACAAAGRDSDLLPRKTSQQNVNSLAADAKIFRKVIVQLRAVKGPASTRVIRHRVDIQLEGVTAFADSMDRLYRAAHGHSYADVKAAFRLFKEELDALDALSSTYKTLGVSECVALFRVDDEEKSKGLTA